MLLFLSLTLLPWLLTVLQFASIREPAYDNASVSTLVGKYMCTKYLYAGALYKSSFIIKDLVKNSWQVIYMMYFLSCSIGIFQLFIKSLLLGLAILHS